MISVAPSASEQPMSSGLNNPAGERDDQAISARVAHYLRPFKLPIALGLAILFAVTTNIRDYRHTANRKRIEAEGVTVPGEIVEGTHITGRGGRSDLVVRYTTADRQVIVQSFEVTGRFLLG